MLTPMIVQRLIVTLFQLKSSSTFTPIATQPLGPVPVLPDTVTDQHIRSRRPRTVDMEVDDGEAADQHIRSRRPRPADMEVDDTEAAKAEHPRTGVDKVRIIEHRGAGQKIRRQEIHIRELEDRVSAIYLV